MQRIPHEPRTVIPAWFRPKAKAFMTTMDPG